jgi:hypothetical protein
MKQLLLPLFFALILIGCTTTNNSLAVHNSAQGSITLHFRGVEHFIESGSQTTIDDIPNGTFDFATVFNLDIPLLEVSRNDTIEEGSSYTRPVDTIQILAPADTSESPAYVVEWTEFNGVDSLVDNGGTSGNMTFSITNNNISLQYTGLARADENGDVFYYVGAVTSNSITSNDPVTSIIR